MQTETAPSPKPVAKPKAAAPSQTPLQQEVSAAAAEVAKLHSAFRKHSSHLTELPTLEMEKEIILAAADDDENREVDAARLAVIDSQVALVVHGLKRRGAALAEELPRVRTSLVTLRRDILEALSAAQGHQIKVRQNELRNVMAGWKGNALAPDTYVAAVGPVLAACPVLLQLESIRNTIDKWSSSRQTASELLDAATEAADLLAKLGFPQFAADEAGEAALQNPFALLVWSPGRDGWDLHQSYSGKEAADADYNYLQELSCFAGVRRLILMSTQGAAKTERYGNKENLLTGDLARDRNGLKDRGYYGPDDPDWIEDSETWTAPASSSTITASQNLDLES